MLISGSDGKTLCKVGKKCGIKCKEGTLGRWPYLNMMMLFVESALGVKVAMEMVIWPSDTVILRV